MLVDPSLSLTTSCCSDNSDDPVTDTYSDDNSYVTTVTDTYCACADQMTGSCCSVTSRLRIKWVSKVRLQGVPKEFYMISMFQPDEGDYSCTPGGLIPQLEARIYLHVTDLPVVEER